MNKGDIFPVEFAQIRSLVQERLRKTIPEQMENWTHVSGGCETGSTWKRSIIAYEGLGFNLKAITKGHENELDLPVEMLGTKWNLPIAVAPMSAAIGNVCEEVFVELAHGARASETAVGVGYPNGSEVHSKMLETGALVFRIIKPLRDKGKLIDTLKEAQISGCFATGIDIDSMAGLKPNGDRRLYEGLCRSLSLEELKAIRKSVDIPFIIKGVMSIEDARAGLEIGADAIVVSSHAGASLDYCPSPLEVLPGIVEAVGNKMKVLVDSGIRRGSDVIKALALGADAVLIGRLALWGLVMGRSEGLSWILKLMANEMKRTMVLIGVNHLSELNKQCLVPLNEIGDRILSRS